jgi:hypothetical protein
MLSFSYLPSSFLASFLASFIFSFFVSSFILRSIFLRSSLYPVISSFFFLSLFSSFLPSFLSFPFVSSFLCSYLSFFLSSSFLPTFLHSFLPLFFVGLLTGMSVSYMEGTRVKCIWFSVHFPFFRMLASATTTTHLGSTRIWSSAWTWTQGLL